MATINAAFSESGWTRLHREDRPFTIRMDRKCAFSVGLPDLISPRSLCLNVRRHAAPPSSIPTKRAVAPGITGAGPAEAEHAFPRSRNRRGNEGNRSAFPMEPLSPDSVPFVPYSSRWIHSPLRMVPQRSGCRGGSLDLGTWHRGITVQRLRATGAGGQNMASIPRSTCAICCRYSTGVMRPRARA